jgi:hypothetical protein
VGLSYCDNPTGKSQLFSKNSSQLLAKSGWHSLVPQPLSSHLFQKVTELLAGRGPKEPKAVPREAKYQHPDDSAKQWSGRGRQPGWVKDWLDAGKSLEDAKIAPVSPH